MNSDPLDELLRSYSKQPLPSPAERLTPDVWKTIQLRRKQTFWSRMLPILDWREVFGEPRIVVAALAVALLVGTLPAMLAGRVANPRLARESLHFEVFSALRPSLIDRLAATPAAAPTSLRP
ncbi:MAG TPA: hypothetical protein VHD32_00925 [Candidatus Didemnitutus sp.]|nr:hypothetical protein [Candidatus Didemnitutus sp.]